MEIKDLQARTGNVNLKLEVIDKGQIREFEKFGKKGRVCTATVSDATGQVNLTLWNDDIDKVNAGDKIEITNGYVGEYQGELQLSTGKFGKLEVLEKGTATPKQNKKTFPEDEQPNSDEELVENGDDDNL